MEQQCARTKTLYKAEHPYVVLLVENDVEEVQQDKRIRVQDGYNTTAIIVHVNRGTFQKQDTNTSHVRNRQCRISGVFGQGS